jgi:hypothetical protein
VASTDDPQRQDSELDTIVPDSPNKPYDMRAVVQHIIDDGEFLEVQELFARNIICGFGRLDGQVVGVVGNQPAQLSGVLDIESSEKGSRFVRTCTRSTSRSSRSATCPASCRAPHRSGTGSSATAPSCSTPTPRRRSQSDEPPFSRDGHRRFVPRASLLTAEKRQLKLPLRVFHGSALAP